MLTQYGLDISVILATYTPAWVDYILDGKNDVYDESLREKDMLRLYRLRIFKVHNKDEMKELSTLLGAILIQDRRGSGLPRGYGQRFGNDTR